MTLPASSQARHRFANKADPPGFDAFKATLVEPSQPVVLSQNSDDMASSQANLASDDKRLASQELDEEIGSVRKLYKSSNSQPADEEETFAGSSSAGTDISKKEATVDADEDSKFMEELKVVRHLTRPMQHANEHSRTSKSKRAKRKGPKKRGNSLERDISRAILQTASAGASEAHFLVEVKAPEEVSTKSAQFILSDLGLDHATSNDVKEEEETVEDIDPQLHEILPRPPYDQTETPQDQAEPSLGHEEKTHHEQANTPDEQAETCDEQVDVPDVSLMTPDASEYSKSLFVEPEIISPSTQEAVIAASALSEDLNCGPDVVCAGESSYLNGFSTPPSSDGKGAKDLDDFEGQPGEQLEVTGQSAEDDPFQGLESDDSFSWREIVASSTSKSFGEMEAIPEEKRADYNEEVTRRIRAHSKKQKILAGNRIEKSRNGEVDTAGNLAPDPSLKDLSFGSLSSDKSEAKPEEAIVETPEALIESSDPFGTDDDWTTFEASPFYASFKEEAAKTPQQQPVPTVKWVTPPPAPRLKPIQPPRKASPRRVLKPYKNQTSKPKMAQPRSPASVHQFQPTTPSEDPWDLEFPRSEDGEVVGTRISI